MKLSLYLLPGCPYCIKVLDAATRLGIDLHTRDVSREPRAREELYAARGRGTVPVLRVEAHGRAELIGESDTIVRFLEDVAEVRSSAA